MTQDEVVPMDKLAKIYIKIRSKLALLTQQYETEAEALKTQQAEISAAMKDQMLALNSTSLKTVNGLIILSKKTRYWCGEWDSFYEFIVENNACSLLEKRIAQKNMAEFLEANPEKVPPSLNSETEYAISVRKPT